MERQRGLLEGYLPIPYSIHKREFNSGFRGRRRNTRESAESEQYKFGDRVTRDNFVDMLIDSFTQSRGFPLIQFAYFSWLQTTSGFDFSRTIRNYIDAGGWSTLSAKEQQRIRDLYEKLPHKNPFNEQVFDAQVLQNINSIVLRTNPLIPEDELRGMPKELFLNRIREEHKNLVSLNRKRKIGSNVV